jgi:hypothetical protein
MHVRFPVAAVTLAPAFAQAAPPPLAMRLCCSLRVDGPEGQPSELLKKRVDELVHLDRNTP